MDHSMGKYTTLIKLQCFDRQTLESNKKKNRKHRSTAMQATQAELIFRCPRKAGDS